MEVSPNLLPDFVRHLDYISDFDRQPLCYANHNPISGLVPTLICFETPNLAHPHAESDPCPATFQSGQRRTIQAELLLSYPSTSDLKHKVSQAVSEGEKEIRIE